MYRIKEKAEQAKESQNRGTTARLYLLRFTIICLKVKAVEQPTSVRHARKFRKNGFWNKDC